MKSLAIIIPHYNRPGLLRKLLASIPKRSEIEVIVVDDRSDKNVEAYIEVVNDTRNSNVRFLKNDSGIKGAGACRNIGIEAATAEWVLFADSDDYFAEAWFEKVQPYFGSNYDVVFFPPSSTDLQTGAPATRHMKYDKMMSDVRERPNPDNVRVLKYQFLAPWSKLIRTSLLRDHTIRFATIPVSEDVIFSTKVSYYMTAFAVSDDVIYCCTESSGSMTTTVSERRYRFEIEVKISQWEFLRAHLSRRELEACNISSIGILTDSLFVYHNGAMRTYTAYRVLRRHGIPLFSRQQRSLTYSVNKIIQKQTLIAQARHWAVSDSK